MDKGMSLHKELAMPQTHKHAEKEATGKAPDSFPGSTKTVVKNMEKASVKGCGVKNMK